MELRLSRCPLVSALLDENLSVYFSDWKRDGKVVYLDKDSNSDIFPQLLDVSYDCRCEALFQTNKYGCPDIRTRKYKINFSGVGGENKTDEKCVCIGKLDGRIREELNEVAIERLKKELKCEKVISYI